ncbi:MAG: LysM peptidoglycan-binding domain-containing protein [Bacteroidetes bacterium]|nr:LysM peptidoglycan-binding domain-containing protein [Bacteroidota bacterium]
MGKIIAAVVVVLSCMDALATIASPPDTLKKYSWIREDLAFIEYSELSVIKSLHEKLKSKEALTIVHFGDSHVQNGISTSVLRSYFQHLNTNGGRGIIFPFSISRLYAGIDYSSRHTGYWQSVKNTDPNPKLPLGVTGVTARTMDPNASFTITFREKINTDSLKLKVYCRRNDKSFDLKIISDGSEKLLAVYDSSSNKTSIDVPIYGGIKQLTFRMAPSQPTQNEFELYALSVENLSKKGTVVHNLGIPGAPYEALLLQSLLGEQLQDMQPDLIVLDLGTNDYIPGNRLQPELELKIKESIRTIRSAATKATILLTSTQDMNRRGINMSAGRKFSAMIRKVAAEEKCLLFDWYWISGGPHTMKRWVIGGLAQRDNIHLNTAGYQLKGELMVRAFSNTLKLLNDSLPEALVNSPDTLTWRSPVITASAKIPSPPSNYQRQSLPAGSAIQHRIREGETLGAIAEQYGVTVQSIQEANNLQGSRIYAGRTLNIVVGGQKKPVTKTEAGPIKSSGGKGLIKHQIIAGETLGTIAAKYKVSIESIKKTNGLKNSRIEAGKILLIENPESRDQKNKT